MHVIPVIDLKGGVVVRAHKGDRANYRAIETPLSPTSDPVDVVGGLLTLFAFPTLYVADLDAIAGQGDHRAVLAKLRLAFPALTLWVDNGIADAEAARAWLGEGFGELVIGSESQHDTALLERLRGEPRAILSLDYRGGEFFQGPPELLLKPELWPRRVIAMTLAKVGSGAGPDLGRLIALRAVAADHALYAAGGVRDLADLRELQAAGIRGALVASALHDGRLRAEHFAALQPAA